MHHKKGNISLTNQPVYGKILSAFQSKPSPFPADFAGELVQFVNKPYEKHNEHNYKINKMNNKAKEKQN